MIKNRTLCLLIAIGELIMSIRSHLRGDTNWEIVHHIGAGLFLAIMLLIYSIEGEQLLGKSKTTVATQPKTNSRLIQSNSPNLTHEEKIKDFSSSCPSEN